MATLDSPFIAWWEKSLVPSECLFFVLSLPLLIWFIILLLYSSQVRRSARCFGVFMTSLTTLLTSFTSLSEIVPVRNFGLLLLRNGGGSKYLLFSSTLIQIFKIRIIPLKSNRYLVQPHLLFKYIKTRKAKIVGAYFILGILSIASLSRLTFQDSFRSVYKDHPLTKSVSVFKQDYGLLATLNFCC